MVLRSILKKCYSRWISVLEVPKLLDRCCGDPASARDLAQRPQLTMIVARDELLALDGLSDQCRCLDDAERERGMQSQPSQQTRVWVRSSEIIPEYAAVTVSMVLGLTHSFPVNAAT
jgi:hypothetical protein